MKTYGLKIENLQEIRRLLQVFFGDLPDAKVYLFGSRAIGRHKKFSDIDLAVKSKAKDIGEKISLFKEAWEKSNIPYSLDLTSWKEIFRPYLPKINKEKELFWNPEQKHLHPWRVCPYGQHWVIRHPRYPLGGKIQDVDGHCRRNPSGKDFFEGIEIEFISKLPEFQQAIPKPSLYNGDQTIPNANEFDALIAGWCKYWNEIFKPDTPITPNFIKALIESESTFNPNAMAENKIKSVGRARGLIQLTESTLRILKNRKGELKDHYVDLKKEELFDPNKNICAAIRWMFRKKEILHKRLNRAPNWVEVVVEYKGLGKQLKNNGEKAVRIMKDFNSYLKNYP